MKEVVERVEKLAAAQSAWKVYAGQPQGQFAADLSALLAYVGECREALKPFAAVSANAKGKDDACWCGQDGAVIRYRDLRRAARQLEGGG